MDDNVPFSPPAHDDSFFYIRYPGAGSAGGGPKPEANEKMSISDQIRASVGATNQLQGPMGHISAAVVKEMALEQQAAVAQAKVDLSKHTEPCRQYLTGANSKCTRLIHFKWDIS